MAALVTSIVGLVLTFSCGIGFIAAIVALVLASQADRKIRDSGGSLTGEGLTRAARIMSWIDLAITALGVLVLIVIFVLAASTSTDSGELGLLALPLS